MPGSPGNPGGSPVPAWSFGRVAVTQPRSLQQQRVPEGTQKSQVSCCSLSCVPAAAGKALLWQQDVVWDVTSSAASPLQHRGLDTRQPRAVPELSPRCLLQQPVLIAVPARSIFHQVLLWPPGVTGVTRSVPGLGPRSPPPPEDAELPWRCEP